MVIAVQQNVQLCLASTQYATCLKFCMSPSCHYQKATLWLELIITFFVFDYHKHMCEEKTIAVICLSLKFNWAMGSDFLAERSIY